MSEERDYEKEALADGWNPNFEGEGKKDAETFVKDGEKISGLLKAKNVRQDEKIDRLEQRIDSLTKTNADFKKYTDKQIKQEKDANAELIAKLEATKAQAITDGDGLAAVKADRDIQDLQVNEEVPPNNAEYEAMSRAWAEENKWYAKNRKLRAYADGIADSVIFDGYTGQGYFDELTRRTKEDFPEEFKNPNREKAGSVEDGGSKEVDDSKEHTWANLPAADKAIANRFIKDMPDFTKEQFLNQYDWE